MKKYTTYIKCVLLCAIVISISVCIAGTDLEVVKKQVHQIGYSFIYVMLASCMAYVFGAWAWKFCFIEYKKVAFLKLLYARTIGENIALFNPTNIVAGEVTKYQLIDTTGLSKKDRLNSILISRILLISTQLLLTFLCLFQFIQWEYLVSLFSALLACILIVYMLRNLINGLIERVRRRSTVIQSAHTRLRSIWSGVSDYFLNHPKQLTLAILFSLLHWCGGALELCTLFYLLGLNPEFITAMSLDMGVVILKSAAGFIPGQIGIEELGNKWMLALLSVSVPGLWISVSILRRLKQIIWIVLCGLFYFIPQLIKIKKKKNYGSIIHHT